MLGIVNTIDMNRGRQVKLIRDLETRIAATKNRLTEIDKELAALAAPHMSYVPGVAQTAYEASKRLIENRARHAWFRDRPARSLADAGVSNADVEALLTARKTVKNDLKYLGERLPSCANIPEPETLRRWHEDLTAAEKFVANVEGLALTRRVIAKLGLDGAKRLATNLKRLADGVEALKRQPWTWNLAESLLSNTAAACRLDPLARSFLADAEVLIAKRGVFLSRPVDLPNQLPPEKPLIQILEALVEGKNPFGLLAFAAKVHQPAFEAMRVAGAKPRTAEDWQHVRAFIDFCADVTNLSARWDALRPELSAPAEFGFAVWALSPLGALSDILRAALVSVPNAINDLSAQLSTALANDSEANAILENPPAIASFADALSRHVASVRLSAVQQNVSEAAAQFEGSDCELARCASHILTELIGKAELDAERLTKVWQGLRAQLEHIRALEPYYQRIVAHTDAIARAGAPIWAVRLKTEPVKDAGDLAAPSDWSEAWEWARQINYLESIGATADLSRLHNERLATEKELRDGFAALVKERTFYNLAATMKGSAKAALQGFANIIRRLGAGTGQRAVLHRQNARQAMQGCYEAVPCWIMPTWRVSEQLPAELASFDLVIMDEASQSDARELPALLRGKKVLVVGDDRQVSPSSAFLSIANIARLRQNFLSEFPFRAEVEPGASIYDLARVMFPAKFVMLKEHFRCVEPIIRFSMQFYNENLIPLRVPKPSERLAPPLIDIFVEDGRRRGRSKVNPAEAEIVVREIEKIVGAGSSTAGDNCAPVRSIGVVSLIGSEQALHIQKLLMERIGEAAMVRHRIVCGDSATLQGDERDVVFISMVADGSRKQSQTSTQYQQRFNVALSRARDRMVLVRSVREEELNPNDLKAKVIAHFRDPMPREASQTAELIEFCQSEFERIVFRELVQRGYHVTPQVGSVGFSIDMVVEGEGGRRLAIECDGDRYHGPERWADDMRRQRILERVGWNFWRCFGSNYSLDPDGVLADLIETLDRMRIEPIELGAVNRGFSEHRIDRVESPDPSDGGLAAGRDEISIVETQLTEGDRVVVRYLDVEPSRPEFYTIHYTLDDRVNGYLLATSPLGQALAHGSPGDEVGFEADGRERLVLFVSLETVSAKAA
jgi:very-short-patch-repair endonuclease